MLLDGGQQVVGQGPQVDERVGGLVHVGHRDPVPGAGGDLWGEQSQDVPAVQEGQGPLPAVLVQPAQALGVDAGPGGGPVATAGELGELLEGLVGGDRPGIAGPVQGTDVAVQAGADGGEPVAQGDDPGDVELGRLNSQALTDALGGVLTPGGVLGEVQDHGSQALLTQGGRDGVPIGTGGGHVQHGAPGGGGVGEDGGQGSGDVGAGGRIDEEARPGAHRLDDVELGGLQVPHTTLGPRDPVGGDGRRQLDAEGLASPLVSGDGRDQGGGARALQHCVEVLDQRLTGVDEGADDETLVDLETGQVLAAQGSDAGQGGPGRESRRGQSRTGDVTDVGGALVAAQGTGEDRVHLDRGIEGEGGVRGGAGQADGAQQDGGVDGAHAGSRGDLGDGEAGGGQGVAGGVLGGDALDVWDLGGQVRLRRGAVDEVDGAVVLSVLGNRLVPGGHPDGQVDRCDAELAGQDVRAGGDLPQGLAGRAQGVALAHDAGQVGGASGVELGQARGVRGREIDDAVEQGDVIQARHASQIHELAAPGGQGRINALAPLDVRLAQWRCGRGAHRGRGRRFRGGLGRARRRGQGPQVSGETPSARGLIRSDRGSGTLALILPEGSIAPLAAEGEERRRHTLKI